MESRTLEMVLRQLPLTPKRDEKKMMKKFFEWLKEDPNDPPTFGGVLAFSNKEIFWFTIIMFTIFSVKIIQSINL